MVMIYFLRPGPFGLYADDGRLVLENVETKWGRL